MSDLEDWKARGALLKVPTIGNGDPFIQCGLGRKSQRWSYGGAPHDSVLAREWEDLGEAALMTEHARFDAADLDGFMVGDAFLKFVIRDPKAQAAGKWLCLERPIFGQLFEDGKLPAVKHDQNRRRSSTRAGHLPVYANVGYTALKRHRRPLPGRTLSLSTTPHATLVWDHKWPVALDHIDLTKIFGSEYSPDANYHDDPFEGPIYHAAKALADRHRAFFDLLRSPLLVAEGTFKATGQEMTAG